MMSVHELVDAKANETPHAIAIRDDKAQVTYRELQSRADLLARQLQGVGVSCGTPIGLSVPRSADLAIGALGILKAGCSYVPVDPEDPALRVSKALEDAGCKLVVTQKGMLESEQAGRWQNIYLDQDLSWEPTKKEIRPETAAEDLAYVIFTSGSTGTPKGVQITHANLLNLIHWHIRTFNISSSDNATLQASPGFDAAVWELWPYLVSGATVHVVEDSLRANPEALRNWMVVNGITISFLPTAVAESMIELEWPPETRLRFLLTGADVLHRFPPPGLPFTLINNYGPTECTVVTTSGPVLPEINVSRLPEIGRPIENVRVYVVDEQLKPVPPGMPGELLIGGAGVGRGYLGRPELTKDKFLPDLFGGVKGDCLYRTGDLVRMEANGQLAFLGRLDQQVKIRGFRIEPAEIEAVIQRHTAIQSSLVVSQPTDSGDAALFAYVVMKPGSSTTSGELRSFIATHLPAHMVPATFVQISELPVTSNGKMDRSSLPAPTRDNILPDDRFEAPRSGIESWLANFLIKMLGVPRISRTDNFFRLGGHSLLGPQLIAKTQQTFDVELSLRSLFDHPTVEGIALQISEAIHTRLDAMTEDEARKILESFSGEITV